MSRTRCRHVSATLSNMSSFFFEFFQSDMWWTRDDTFRTRTRWIEEALTLLERREREKDRKRSVEGRSPNLFKRDQSEVFFFIFSVLRLLCSSSSLCFLLPSLFRLSPLPLLILFLSPLTSDFVSLPSFISLFYFFSVFSFLISPPLPSFFFH